MTKANNNYYVDNKKLYQHMVEYKKLVNEHTGEGQKPEIPPYVGRSILMIANRLSLKPNFINYSYREEMICDGVENCITYINNFNPDRTNNPFAYFTQIIYFAFLRRIQREKKQVYIKHKSLENSIILNTLNGVNDFDDGEFEGSYAIENDNQNMNDFIKNFEDGLEKKKNKRKQSLENIILDNEDLNIESSTDN
jgi:hypothetical protein